IEALDGYSKGLGLYYGACTEEDYGVKENLVSQGGIYLNKSVGTVNKAYAEIENLKSAGPPVAKEEASEQITEEEITEGMTSADTGVETQEQNTAVPNPPAQQTKSKDQVLAEISQKVQADMEAKEAEENGESITESAEIEQPVERREEASKPEPPKVETKAKTPEKTEAPAVKAPEPTAEPTPVPPPPTEAPSLKSEEEPAPETASTGEENVEPQQGKGEESKEPKEEESGKGNIEALNQKIMEKAGSGQESKAVDETVPAEGEAQLNQQDKAADTATPPAVQDSGNAEPASPAAGEENKEVAVVPPGGTTEELKEEEGPMDEIKSWCQERYEVQTERDDCEKHRAAAKNKVDKLSNSYPGGTKEKDVLDKCMTDWKEGGTYNYEMVISCTQFFCTQRGIEDCKDLSK
ncbi:MAG TPA: hypothetical protein VJV40_06450, partial [Thermodesulfobacteriota bacterium]|nr:hypothetical protein [Thermodesulfobacteriota bacterium]